MAKPTRVASMQQQNEQKAKAHTNGAHISSSEPTSSTTLAASRRSQRQCGRRQKKDDIAIDASSTDTIKQIKKKVI